MVRTYGLTHIALLVRDAERSLRFYQHVLGVVPVYREHGFIQAQTPESRDVLVFDEGDVLVSKTKTIRAGQAGGIKHFGFRLADPADIDAAAAAIETAGGKILSRGEFVPGEPYLFFADPDGYEVEIWFEIPTPVDPKG
jgi:catechol 2,3-dioxygenase-like lactoylglutathione lyase family enzyme